MDFIVDSNTGWIEVITGGMFAGKSEELIRRVRRAKFANLNAIVFKHTIDTRYDGKKISSHNQNYVEAIPVKDIDSMRHMLKLYIDTKVVAIDEAQFFEHDIVEFCDELANLGLRVIIAGLDQDFRGEPFKPMDSLMSKAEYVDKLHAICLLCGNPASKTQRLINGNPAAKNSPTILVGANETYEPRCRKCYKMS